MMMNLMPTVLILFSFCYLVVIMQLYTFEKTLIPEDLQEATAFGEKLIQFGISLQQYKASLEMDDITM